MPKVTLPDGCYGMDFDDGSRVNGREGATVEVTDSQAAQIDNSWYSRSGIVNRQRLSFGTRKGKRCVPCKRLWNYWSDSCPKCGEPTEEDE
jgi:hypothetical protein